MLTTVTHTKIKRIFLFFFHRCAKGFTQRLCYSGEILKVKNNSLNMSRQSIQIGSEIIGIEENSCENQVINLIIDILQKLKIKKFIINFTMPTLIESISKDFNLNKKDYEYYFLNYRNKPFIKIELFFNTFNLRVLNN